MLKRGLLLLAVALAGCTGPQLPFEKEQPLAGGKAELVHPPWEAFVKAGPGAEKELDLETLNGPGGQLKGAPPTEQPVPPPLIADTEAAGRDVPVEKIEETPPAVAKAAPAPKPAKKKEGAVVIKSVAVPMVKGAKGKGNAELTEAMRRVLRDAGWPVIDVARADALTIKGEVLIDPPKGENQNVSLKWIVSTPDGKVLGDVAQSNEVPAGSVDAGFGENAQYATEAAADGIFKLIQKYR